MKTKGISFWEQHVEHLVLGLAVVVMLVLVAMQFVGEPNAVTVGTTTVSPGTVNQVLDTKAREIDAQLQSATAVGTVAVKPVSAVLQEQLAQPVAPPGPLALGQPHLPIGDDKIVGKPQAYFAAGPPRPLDPTVRQSFDTLAPDGVEQSPELKAVFAAAPYDVTWNTVYARFNVADMLKQFAEVGPNGEPSLPMSWFNNRVDFIDLKLMREEYVDGQWTNATVIDPMLARPSFRAELKDRKVDDSLRQSVVTRAADVAMRQQIIQPLFYPTLNGVWTPPPAEGVQAQATAVVAANLTPEEAEIVDLTRRRDLLQGRLAAVIKELQDKGCPDSQPPPTSKEPAQPKPKSSGGGTAAPGAGSISGESSGAMGGRTNTGSANNAAACKSAWARRKRFEMTLAQINADLEKLQGQQAAKPAEQPKEVVEEKPADVINIWAHDLSITPGKTYRYRMVVEVYNPLFGRKPSLIPEQQALAEQFVLASEASEWTSPITVEPPLRVFVTNAQPANPGSLGAIGVGSAQAEVYRFHNGRWWVERFRVQPGDRIGETKPAKGGADVDYSTDWFVLDVVEGLNVDDQDTRRGFGATVVLQSLTMPNLTASRSPRNDYSDPERRRLLDEVKFAEMGDGEAVASSAGATGGAN